MPRLSSQALYALRNHINIERLMTQVLHMTTHEINGRVRFQCPLCARFHTATHPNTNLARCFDCRKNFNTIELVMAVRHIRFLEAVALLQRYQKILDNRSHPSQSQRVSPNTRASPNPNPWVAPAHACDVKAKPAQQQRTSTKATSQLIAIKQILNMR
jgi:hypothetical protein